MEFDKVLENPLWTKKSSPLDAKMTVYHFKVSKEATVLYTVDPESQLVAATSLPKDLKDFRPNVQTFDIAWKRWFAPWCCNPDIVKLLELFLDTPLNWICNTQTPMITCSYLDDNMVSFTHTIELTPKGKIRRAKTEFQDLFPAPRDDDVPISSKATFEEIYADISGADGRLKKIFVARE
jgi:hypothetical protein